MLAIEREQLAPVWDEAMPLFAEHWQAFQGDSGIPFKPKREQYAALDAAGMVLFVSVRDAGAMVGYWLGLMVENMHSAGHVVCMADGMFIKPAYRNGSGRRLLAVVEDAARNMGAARLVQATCARFPIDAWLKRLGFVIEDRVYLKELK